MAAAESFGRWGPSLWSLYSANSMRRLHLHANYTVAILTTDIWARLQLSPAHTGSSSENRNRQFTVALACLCSKPLVYKARNSIRLSFPSETCPKLFTALLLHQPAAAWQLTCTTSSSRRAHARPPSVSLWSLTGRTCCFWSSNDNARLGFGSFGLQRKHLMYRSGMATFN